MALQAGEDRFDMGRVVNRAFRVIGRNWVMFVGLAVLLTLLPTLLIRLAVGIPTAANALSPSRVLTSIGSLIVGIFLSYLMQASVSHATIADLDGQHPAFGRTLGTGLRFAVPLFFLAVVTLIGVYGGLFLIVVPGVILFLMWCVATPAMVNENLSVFASLGRSRTLTKGHRWAILGLLVIVGLLTVAPAMLVPILGGAFSNPAAYAASPFSTPQMISAVLGIGVSIVFSVIIAAIYVELRTIKDGANPQSLTEIFA